MTVCITGMVLFILSSLLMKAGERKQPYPTGWPIQTVAFWGWVGSAALFFIGIGMWIEK